MDQGFIKAFSRRPRVMHQVAGSEISRDSSDAYRVGNEQGDEVVHQGFGLEIDQSIADSAIILPDNETEPTRRVDCPTSQDVDSASRFAGNKKNESDDIPVAWASDQSSDELIDISAMDMATLQNESTEEDLDEHRSSHSLQHTLTAYSGVSAERDQSSEMPDLNRNRVLSPSTQASLEDAPVANPQVSLADSIPAPFRAAWEVDAFQIPETVTELFVDGDLSTEISERLSEAASSGLQSIFVSSVQPQEGRTSIAIGLAIAAAASGLRVALLEGDAKAPTLLDDLQLEVQHGWTDIVHDLPLAEVAVTSLEDRFTILPLTTSPIDQRAVAECFPRVLADLKQQFDLVIIDGGFGSDYELLNATTHFDSAVLVQDVRRTESSEISQLYNQLMNAGVRGVGVVENFK